MITKLKEENNMLKERLKNIEEQLHKLIDPTTF